MSYVRIKKTGLYSVEWDGEREKYVRRRIKKLSVWRYLRETCRVDEGVTLLDIFNIVDKYESLKVFLSQYSMCHDLEAFHAQAKEPADLDVDMTELEVYWYGNYDEDGEFCIQQSFHGLGPNSEWPDGKIRWGLDFCPVQKFAQLPVKLNTDLTFYDPGMAKLPNGDYKILLKGKRHFTLQEVLDAIYWEISFVGGPDEKNELKDMIEGQIDDIKNGVISGIPAEEVFKAFGFEPPKEGESKIMMTPNIVRQLGLDPEQFNKEEDA